MIRLRLYVTGHTISAERARTTLRNLERHLAGQSENARIRTEIIDVLEHPEDAAADRIFATPTLMSLAPGPQKRLFGDLSSLERVMNALNLNVRAPQLAETA